MATPTHLTYENELAVLRAWVTVVRRQNHVTKAETTSWTGEGCVIGFERFERLILSIRINLQSQGTLPSTSNHPSMSSQRYVKQNSVDTLL